MSPKVGNALTFVFLALMLSLKLLEPKSMGPGIAAVYMLAEFALCICILFIAYKAEGSEKGFIHYVLDSLKKGAKSSLLIFGATLLFIGFLSLMLIDGWPALIALAAVIAGIIMVRAGYKNTKNIFKEQLH